MQKPKVLIVDDDPAVTDYLRAKLGRSYTVLTSNRAAEVAALSAAELPELILCDVSMPELDGYELCRHIKSNPQLQEIPVILLTGSHTEAPDEARGFKAGAVDYLNKTLDLDILEARLQVHLALRKAQEALRNQNQQLEAKVAERTAELEANREALREAMHNLRTTRVATGVYWVQVPEAGLYILCGSPPDVVKHLMLKGYIADEHIGEVQCETGPNVILLSDVLVQNGSFSNLAEFPVLQMLYRQGMILPGHPNNTGRKPILIGSPAQLQAQLDYIYRGNYGLVNAAELQAAGLTEDEAACHMALKLRFAFGAIRESGELLETRELGAAPVPIANGVTARRIALNRYEFAYRGRTTQVDLNLAPGQAYESPYTPGQHHVEAQYFGVIHCGEGDGWDLRRQSMGSIVMFQGRYYLVDAGPSVLHTLRSLGIDISEIAGIFHTHAHDDHFAGLPSLLLAGRRIKYFATRLVRHSVTKKLAALMSVEERLFENLFDVHDLVVGQWNYCDGMEVMPLDSPHPVENTIFHFRVRDGAGYTSYAHWADIASMDVLTRLVSAPPALGVLPPDYVDKVRARYLTAATLKKIDAGGGLIHGAPLDFRGDYSEKIVLAHRAATFSEDELEVGSQAIFGAVDVLMPTNVDYVHQRAARYLCELFPDASVEALGALLRPAATEINSGSLLLKSGTRPTYLYLLVGGSVECTTPNSEAPLAQAPGSLLGIERLFSDVPLESSWRAISPVKALCLDLDTLRAFLLNGGWLDRLRTLLDRTARLRSMPLFGERIALRELDRLAAAARHFGLAPGELRGVEEAASLCVVLSGAVQIVGPGERLIETLAAGGFFGEEACLGRSDPGWTVHARDAATLLAFPPGELRDVPVILWKLLEAHERRLRIRDLF